MRRLTERQMQLLADLAALEEAGMISSRETVYGDETSWGAQVDLPGVVTASGRAALAQQEKAGADG